MDAIRIKELEVMKRSMMLSLTLPFALAGCPADPPGSSSTGEDETEGITTLTTVGDGDGDQTGDGDGEPGDGDGDGDTGPSEDMPNCGEVSIVPTYVPPQIMLVVDASGSMVVEANKWDHDLDPDTAEVTRWFSLHGVVDTIMTNFGAAMYSGLQRFPSAAACDPHPCYNATSCSTESTPEVEMALDNGMAILGALPGPNADSTEIEGGTPATKGIVSALDHLLMQPEELPRYLLLVTDGAANCNTDLPFPDYIETYDETLPTTVEDAFMNEGIPTFVVGIDIQDALSGVGSDGAPEANPYERLNDVALAGGVPKNEGMDAEKFFNATNQGELLMALEGILGEITDCTIDLSEAGELPDPIQIPYITFTSDGLPVPGPVDDCETEDGWAWIEVGVIMTFCGTYCDDFKNGTAAFDGTYGCPPPG
jgi:hypothetical protein